ncbi:MAG: DUF2975 domain-containing protein [Clostridiales bacterium]|nr:DUF2975 domain-containing protein [Clostridiales bacterium]
MESKYNNKIITWSKVATVFFLILMAAADVIGVSSARYLCVTWTGRTDTLALAIFTIVYYAITVMAFILLISVFKLLSNMSRDLVFDRKNTRLMTAIVLALVFTGFFFVLLAFVWGEAAFLALTAWFMALIVLSVKVVFDKAIVMKNDLDLTI